MSSYELISIPMYSRWGRTHLPSQISWLLLSSCAAAEKRFLARRIYWPDVEQVILDSAVYPRSSAGVVALHLLGGGFLFLPYGSRIIVRLPPVRVAQSCHLVSITPRQSAGRQPNRLLGKLLQRVWRSCRGKEARRGSESPGRWTPLLTESCLAALPPGRPLLRREWVDWIFFFGGWQQGDSEETALV